MYVDFLLRWKTGSIPKTITKSSVYAVVTRRSLLGFHKMCDVPLFDPACTKTELLVFVSEAHANSIVSILEKSHQNTVQFSREINYSDHSISKIKNSLRFDIKENEYADSIKPMSVEIIPYNHLEKLCLLHYFDMLITHDMNIIQHGKNEYEIAFDCYQYRTLEFPNKKIHEKMLRDMLYMD